MASDISTDSKGQTAEGGGPRRILLFLPLSSLLQLSARGVEPLSGPFPVPRIGRGVPVLQRRLLGLLLPLSGTLRVQGAGRAVGRGGCGRELRGVAGDRGVETGQSADGRQRGRSGGGRPWDQRGGIGQGPWGFAGHRDRRTGGASGACPAERRGPYHRPERVRHGGGQGRACEGADRRKGRGRGDGGRRAIRK